MEENEIKKLVKKVEECVRPLFYIDRNDIRKLLENYKNDLISLDDLNTGLLEFKCYMEEENKDGIKNVMTMEEFKQFTFDVKKQMKEKKKEFIEKNGIRQIKREINYYRNKTDATFEPRYTQKLEILDNKIKDIFMNGEGIEELDRLERIEMNLDLKIPTLENSLVKNVDLLLKLINEKLTQKQEKVEPEVNLELPVVEETVQSYENKELKENREIIKEFKNIDDDKVLNAKTFFKNLWSKKEENVDEKNMNASEEPNELTLNFHQENNEKDEQIEATVEEEPYKTYQERIEKLKKDLEKSISTSLPTSNAKEQGEFIKSLFEGMEDEEKSHGK